jgi:hypothetical protein
MESPDSKFDTVFNAALSIFLVAALILALAGCAGAYVQYTTHPTVYVVTCYAGNEIIFKELATTDFLEYKWFLYPSGKILTPPIGNAVTCSEIPVVDN